MLYIRHMIRTQIYLPKDLYHEIAFKAKRESKPKSAVIREALKEGLKQGKTMRNAGSVLLEIAKEAKRLKTRGPRDLSTNIDKYLYEDE